MKHVKRPVTVEDLLRLKRAERPADGFWLEFDQQLRAKQLSALVERRPWWRSVSLAGLWAGFRRYQLPLGAAAVLAISIFSYQASQRSLPVPVVVSDDRVLQTEPARLSELVGGARIQGENSQVVAHSVGHSDAADAEPGRETEVESSQSHSDKASILNAPAYAESDLSAFASPMAVALAIDPGWSAGALVEPVLSRSLLATSTRFEARALPVRSAVEPLKQITPPAERRGARILTAMVSMASVENAMRTTERAANRLSEEQLYDQIRRVGAFGAGVNVKF